MKLFELYNVLKDGQKGRNNFLVTVIQGNGTGSRYFLADGEVKAQCGSGDRDRTAAGTGAAGGEWYCRSRWEKIICGITETAGTSGDLWSGTCGTAGDPSGRKSWIYGDCSGGPCEFCRRSTTRRSGSGDL